MMPARESMNDFGIKCEKPVTATQRHTDTPTNGNAQIMTGRNFSTLKSESNLTLHSYQLSATSC